MWNYEKTGAHSTENVEVNIIWNVSQVNLLKFSPTWSCVSLPLPTISSGWKLLIYLIWAQIFTNLDNSFPRNKRNESGFRPPLCTDRLNWARRTSWGWWDDWNDTVLQTQDSKFEPWRSEAEHATSRSRRLPTILTSFPITVIRSVKKRSLTRNHFDMFWERAFSPKA